MVDISVPTEFHLLMSYMCTYVYSLGKTNNMHVVIGCNHVNAAGQLDQKQYKT